MVYCGKPSTGCGNCKSRRIKCDEARQSCQNCTKTHRECPGYPNEVDLIFRNEEPGLRRKAKKNASSSTKANNATLKRPRKLVWVDDSDEQRALKKRRRGTEANIESYESLQWISVDSRRANSLPSPTEQLKLNPSMEKQASLYFMNNFVLASRNKDTATGFLEVAAPMLDQAKDGSPLCLATEAVAIAVMSRPPGPVNLAQHAARLYGRALAATQKAMQDPKHATSDETLLTILLFSLYESMTSSEHSIAAWTKHIEGAVAIVKARGVKQFENPQSLQLFRAVRTQMLTNAMHQRKPIEEFPGPKGWLSDMEGNAACGLLGTSVAMPNLLSRACNLMSQEKSSRLVQQAEDLLEDALEAQSNLSFFEAHIPPRWAHDSFADVPSSFDHTIKIEDTETWPGPTHKYTDISASSIRNHTRVNQMLCSSIIMDTMKWLDPEDYEEDDRYAVAKSRVQSLVDEVCYSVPFHLLDHKIDQKSAVTGEDRNASDALSAQFLIWPLYTAMNMKCVPTLQRRWLRGRLLAVARRYGLGMLKRANGGTSSSPGRSRNPSPPLDLSTQTNWSSFQGIGAIDPQLLAEGWDSTQDNKTVAPTDLLNVALYGKQYQTFEGLDFERELSPLSPLQRGPIQVV